MSEIKIVERKQVPAGTVMLFGFPDAGLVGVIAASHLIDELKLSEIAYVDSRLLPPLIVLHDGLPHSSMRIFGNDSVLLAISEIPVSSDIIYPIIDSLVEWGKNKNAKLMVSLGGIPVQDRQDLKEPKVFAAASSPDLLKTTQSQNIDTLNEGYIVGPQAVVLMRTTQLGLPAVALLAQCYLHYPDPEAAAEVLRGLTKITGIKVDVTGLLEKGEEIRLKTRDIMKRTQDEMSRMKKGQEYDLPVYVS